MNKAILRSQKCWISWNSPINKPIYLWFPMIEFSKLCPLDHKINQFERYHWRSVIQPPAQSRVRYKLMQAAQGPAGSWKLWTMESAQSFHAKLLHQLPVLTRKIFLLTSVQSETLMNTCPSLLILQALWRAWICLLSDHSLDTGRQLLSTTQLSFFIFSLHKP